MVTLAVLLVAAAVVGSITFTITTTSIFAPVREVVSSWGPKWEQWIHCPWCLSHYVAPALLLVDIKERIFWFGDTYYLLAVSFLISVFAITGFGGLFHYVLLRAYKPVHELMMMRLKEREQEERRRRRKVAELTNSEHEEADLP